ncbi:hypothetical protein K439DRAFT_1630085 [Ramaria rubella]|nr:hypothetical protein K439DRAFT_1630085 [Ramaria rubella]
MLQQLPHPPSSILAPFFFPGPPLPLVALSLVVCPSCCQELLHPMQQEPHPYGRVKRYR